MPITLELGHIIIGSVMFSILGIMIYAQGRIDEMRTNENAKSLIEAAKSLCGFYFKIASEALGEDEVRRRFNARIENITKEIENECGK